MKPSIADDWVVNTAEHTRGFDLQLVQLWRHRELTFFFVLRDVRVRYKQALLGATWAVLQPLVGALMFTILFNRVADVEVEGGSYFPFAVVGFVAWSYVSSAVGGGTGSLLYNADLLTKVSFPRAVLPIAAILPGLIDLGIGLLVAFVASVAARQAPSLAGVLVGMPLGLGLLILAVAGPVLLLSAAVVKYRDILVLVTFGLQLMLFITPVAYPPELLSEGWRTLAYVNPVAGAVGLLRSGVIGAALPTAPQIALSTVVATGVFLQGLIFFRSNERRFADII